MWKKIQNETGRKLGHNLRDVEINNKDAYKPVARPFISLITLNNTWRFAAFLFTWVALTAEETQNRKLFFQTGTLCRSGVSERYVNLVILFRCLFQKMVWFLLSCIQRTFNRKFLDSLLHFGEGSKRRSPKLFTAANLPY